MAVLTRLAREIWRESVRIGANRPRNDIAATLFPLHTLPPAHRASPDGRPPSHPPHNAPFAPKFARETPQHAAARKRAPSKSTPPAVGFPPHVERIGAAHVALPADQGAAVVRARLQRRRCLPQGPRKSAPGPRRSRKGRGTGIAPLASAPCLYPSLLFTPLCCTSLVSWCCLTDGWLSSASRCDFSPHQPANGAVLPPPLPLLALLLCVVLPLQRSTRRGVLKNYALLKMALQHAGIEWDPNKLPSLLNGSSATTVDFLRVLNRYPPLPSLPYLSPLP